MNDGNYATLFSQYQAEQQSLKAQVDELSKRLAVLGEMHDNSQKWIDLIAKYKDLQELDAPIVNELCKKILLHQAHKIDGKRVQKIEIFYRFVGKLSTVDGEAEHEIHGSRHLCVNKDTETNELTQAV